MIEFPNRVWERVPPIDPVSGKATGGGWCSRCVEDSDIRRRKDARKLLMTRDKELREKLEKHFDETWRAKKE